MQSIEGTGLKFNLQTYFAAQNLCKNIVEKIAASVFEGMTEADGQALIKEKFNKAGVTKFWHPSKFRIAGDTVKSFRELPDNTIKLSAGENFFVDVGPIIEEHEADFGDTFLFGGTSPLSTDAKTIWNRTAACWKNDAVTGQALYAYATAKAAELGYRLNPLMAGHRLGDFPHSLFSKESLGSQGFTPAAHLWVLEIHIIHEASARGAFFEDILC